MTITSEKGLKVGNKTTEGCNSAGQNRLSNAGMRKRAGQWDFIREESVRDLVW
jgi:hypothetical protein